MVKKRKSEYEAVGTQKAISNNYFKPKYGNYESKNSGKSSLVNQTIGYGGSTDR